MDLSLPTVIGITTPGNNTVFFIGSRGTTSGNSSFSSASSSSDVIRGISSASESILSKEKSLMAEKIAFVITSK